jgi:hypothetical protein
MKSSLQAAQEIAALINSRPVSPRVDELDAIISSVLTCQHTWREDQTLAALQQKLDEATRLNESDDRDKADAADKALEAVTKRIFAARPITLHNLKLRAVLAKYWQEHSHHGEAWDVPDDCDAWEHTVMAHLIDGVLKMGAPPVQPTVELATFQSAVAGLTEYRRLNPEPSDVHSAEYFRWDEGWADRLEGVGAVADSILASVDPPLDALAAIAVHFVLDDKPESIALPAAWQECGSMATWIIARLLHALQPLLTIFPTESKS